MISKWALFLGIILLATGIVLRITIDLSFVPIIFIVVGASFKTYYIISKARSGEYKPGYELVFLFVGLFMLLSGIYLRSLVPAFNPVFLIICGISLKVLFIILFILNVRSLRRERT